ncbi:MAG: LptF/LptG family permease [Turneriella sp.]|nr:LptF/LptG family permease [Turneriella sp.]
MLPAARIKIPWKKLSEGIWQLPLLRRVYTLDRYLLKHFLPSLFIATVFFTFVIVIFFLKETIRHAVEKNLELRLILELCWYALAWTLTLTVPMAFLLATIVVVGNLNADSEIIALRAGGVTYPRMLYPFLFVAVLVGVWLFWFANFVVPRYADEMENMRQYILNTDPIAVIEPGKFVQLDKREGYVRKIFIERSRKRQDGSELLQNIQVRKIGQSGNVRQLLELIIAQEGRKVLKKNHNGEWVRALRLSRGYLFTYGADGSFQRVDFSAGTLDLNIQEPEQIKKLKRIDDMRTLTLPQLLAAPAELKAYPEGEKLTRLATLELHKRLALSYSLALFVLVGFPLAIVNRRSGKSGGLGIAVIFIFIYFALFISSETFSVRFRFISPILAAHTPSLLMLVIAFWLAFSRLAEKRWPFQRIATMRRKLRNASVSSRSNSTP